MVRVQSLFFSLPIELRLLVYQELLLARPCRNLQILRVCRDIYNEARPVLFKRPLKFRTHEDLYDWVKKADSDARELVTSINFSLLSFQPRTPHSQPLFDYRMQYGYGQDLPDLQNALMPLLNVRELVIFKSTEYLSINYAHDFYFSFFPWLAGRYPELRYLTLFISWIPLDFLLQMRFLRTFRFTGFSRSPPAAALIIFQSLTHLEELEVVGPPLDIYYLSSYTGGMYYGQSVTHEVLLGIRPLKAFTICEVRGGRRHPGMLFSEEIISALVKNHGSSLRSLKISLDFPPSATRREALARLFGLPDSSIKRVELGWPGLDVLTLDVLPHPLRSLQISCDHHFPPDDAAQKLVAQKPMLPELAEVVLRIDWRTRPAGSIGRGIIAVEGPCGKNKMDAAVARLKSAGLEARSGWWHPIMFDDLGDDYDDEPRVRGGGGHAKTAGIL
ncbi:hypothetical protein GP486_001682 [Trichoglossum hirsutum]|uniref:Uncharacterized protein n=1 Tax=Trichoglossum hirsutum TaxID=265104 RepID=A0A9P8LGI7_9PEZI|nr:hypothetical protein GP486_001682 [Trichoglossum hirsutum]